jgi:hypothetical protein
MPLRGLAESDAMNANSLLAGIIFSAIGLGAWIYGKKGDLWKPRLIGLLLMLYPLFVWDLGPLIVIGGILTAALFVFRD